MPLSDMAVPTNFPTKTSPVGSPTKSSAVGPSAKTPYAGPFSEDPSTVNPCSGELSLRGERILFVGKLSSMSRPEVCQLVVQQGADVAGDASLSDVGPSSDEAAITLVVIGDSHPNLDSALQSEGSDYSQLVKSLVSREGIAPYTELVHESELWQRIGLVGSDVHASAGVQKLYTPAMLAELLDVPVAAIRRWYRQGAILACQSVRRLPYFDFSEVSVARHLSALYAAGCSLRVIDRKLAELKRSLPEVERPLCDPSLVVAGRRLYVRRGDELAELGGQLLIDFDKPDDQQGAAQFTDSQMLLPISAGANAQEGPAGFGPAGFGATQFGATQPCTAGGAGILSALDEFQQVALDWEDQGEFARATETYRTMLAVGEPTAEMHFALADLLYRLGDLSAARERYYAAIELDEEYVEARANLGCVLAENGEVELAIAAFQGALAFHSDYADVHYHLAGALDRMNYQDEAVLHWRTFLALAPESPWAEIARSRLGIPPIESEVLSGPLS
jgi:hypothetical protein